MKEEIIIRFRVYFLLQNNDNFVEFTFAFSRKKVNIQDIYIYIHICISRVLANTEMTEQNSMI